MCVFVQVSVSLYLSGEALYMMNTWWGRFLQLKRASHRRAGLLAHKKHESSWKHFSLSLFLSLFISLALSCCGDSKEGFPSQWGMHVRLSHLYAGGHNFWQNNVFTGRCYFCSVTPSLKTLTDPEAPALCISLQRVFKSNVFTYSVWLNSVYILAWRLPTHLKKVV